MERATENWGETGLKMVKSFETYVGHLENYVDKLHATQYVCNECKVDKRDSAKSNKSKNTKSSKSKSTGKKGKKK